MLATSFGAWTNDAAVQTDDARIVVSIERAAAGLFCNLL